MNVRDLKIILDGLPNDAKVYYERIEDIYFDEHGWKTEGLKLDTWWEELGEDIDVDEDEEEGKWIEAYDAFYNKEEEALKITAHY